MPSRCWMTARRPPCSGSKANFVPTPGSCVFRSSSGIRPPWQCRDREEEAPEALRLLHEHDAERGCREHVEPCEGDEVAAVRRRERNVPCGDLRQHDRELAVGHEGGADVDALAPGEAADPARAVAAGALPDEREGAGEAA